MKYKVGDKVRVKSREWYEANKNSNGNIPCEGPGFVEEMAMYCGKIFTIESLLAHGYRLDNCGWAWSDDMLEDALVTGKAYWVSDESEDAAKRNKQERIFAVTYKGENYFKSNFVNGLLPWKYAVPIEKPAEYFIVKKQGDKVTETKLTEKQREELGLLCF